MAAQDRVIASEKGTPCNGLRIVEYGTHLYTVHQLWLTVIWVVDILSISVHIFCVQGAFCIASARALLSLPSAQCSQEASTWDLADQLMDNLYKTIKTGGTLWFDSSTCGACLRLEASSWFASHSSYCASSWVLTELHVASPSDRQILDWLARNGDQNNILEILGEKRSLGSRAVCFITPFGLLRTFSDIHIHFISMQNFI